MKNPKTIRDLKYLYKDETGKIAPNKDSTIGVDMPVEGDFFYPEHIDYMEWLENKILELYGEQGS